MIICWGFGTICCGVLFTCVVFVVNFVIVVLFVIWCVFVWIDGLVCWIVLLWFCICFA